MYLKHHAYLFNIHSTKHDKETEMQNKLHMLFSEEVAPPYQLPISGFKLHIYTRVTQRKPCVHHMYPIFRTLFGSTQNKTFFLDLSRSRI